MKKGFIKKFIEEEFYLQNKPLRMDDFINFCKKRNIYTNEAELEFFEKEGLLYPLFRMRNPINSLGGNPFYPNFEHFEKDLLQDLLLNNDIYDPAHHEFEPYSSFRDKSSFSDKISNYYSSFQIHWINILKTDLMIHMNFSGEKIHISSNSHFKLPFYRDYFDIDSIEDFKSKLEEKSSNEYSNKFFNLELKKDELKSHYQYFNKILTFLIYIQRFYYPYGKSDSKRFYLSNDPSWYEERNLFDLKNVLKSSDLKIENIAKLYKDFSNKTQELLGVNSGDWIQLWMNINWKLKDKLEGPVRLGIDYLQWSIMLKVFLEDYTGEEIPDIDELYDISHHDIIHRKHFNRLQRVRNELYYEPSVKENYWYENTYKKLFYLSNEFRLEYQPRIMVFVEGHSEEKILPILIKWYYKRIGNLGIEIVNFEGVDKLLSTSKTAEDLKNLINDIRRKTKGKEEGIGRLEYKNLQNVIKELEKANIIVSNWTSFISYNLEKWQIIPFFLADNEGKIKQFLETAKLIRYQDEDFNVPPEWKYLWGINNNEIPFKGKDFEFANFNDQEILCAVNEVTGANINIKQVKDVRDQGMGLNQLTDDIKKSGVKIKIVGNLFENLMRKYEKEKNEELLERPIFKLIWNIIELANLNHPHSTTDMEIRNRKTILNILRGKGYPKEE